MRRSLIFIVGCGLLLLPSRSGADEKALITAGVPALSREWSGEEYAKAAKVIASGEVPLPMLTDETGRAFLDRLTATENFSLCRDKNLPFGTRLDNYLKLLNGANTILAQYLAAANKGGDVHAECTWMMVYLLRTAAAGTEIMEEFIPTVPKDEKYAVRMDGLKKMRSGLTTIFAGAETSLSERTFFQDQDLSQLLSAMVETLPTFKKSFARDYELELRHKLEADKAVFSQTKDKQSIDRMLDELGR